MSISLGPLNLPFIQISNWLVWFVCKSLILAVKQIVDAGNLLGSRLTEQEILNVTANYLISLSLLPLSVD